MEFDENELELRIFTADPFVKLAEIFNSFCLLDCEVETRKLIDEIREEMNG